VYLLYKLLKHPIYAKSFSLVTEMISLTAMHTVKFIAEKVDKIYQRNEDIRS